MVRSAALAKHTCSARHACIASWAGSAQAGGLRVCPCGMHGRDARKRGTSFASLAARTKQRTSLASCGAAMLAQQWHGWVFLPAAAMKKYNNKKTAPNLMLRHTRIEPSDKPRPLAPHQKFKPRRLYARKIPLRWCPRDRFAQCLAGFKLFRTILSPTIFGPRPPPRRATRVAARCAQGHFNAFLTTLMSFTCLDHHT
jgi:hypothetical protein